MKALRVATSCRRTCGREGEGGGPGLVVVFFPQPQVLEEGKGDQGQERVMVQTQRLLISPARLSSGVSSGALPR